MREANVQVNETNPAVPTCATGNLGGSKGFTELGGLGGAGLFPTLGLITKFGLLGRVG